VDWGHAHTHVLFWGKLFFREFVPRMSVPCAIAASDNRPTVHHSVHRTRSSTKKRNDKTDSHMSYALLQASRGYCCSVSTRNGARKICPLAAPLLLLWKQIIHLGGWTTSTVSWKIPLFSLTQANINIGLS
jgi:hypothetical protein